MKDPNCSVSIRENKTGIKNFPPKKTSFTDSFTGYILSNVFKESILILTQTFSEKRLKGNTHQSIS